MAKPLSDEDCMEIAHALCRKNGADPDTLVSVDEPARVRGPFGMHVIQDRYPCKLGDLWYGTVKTIAALIKIKENNVY